MTGKAAKDEMAGSARAGTGITEHLARAGARHPWRTIGLWALVVVAALAAIGMLLGDAITTDMQFRGRKPDSIIAYNLIQDRLTGSDQLTDFVIVRSETLAVDDPAFEAYVTEVADRISGLGSDVVDGAVTFYQAGDPTMVSQDKHATLIAVTMAGDIDTAVGNAEVVNEAAVTDVRDGFAVAQTGDASLSAMSGRLAESDLIRAEVLGVPAALIVLLVVFGTVLAAFMPLGLSVISIILATALTAVIGQFYTMNIFVMNILTMMGLAVCLDYTLFVISRYREERARGLEKDDAIAATSATAGRAIFFSGLTVVLAMVGMVVVPLDLTISMGIGVMLVVVTTLATTLVLLPALMGLLGDRINALRIPFVSRYAMRRAESGGGTYERLAHSIMRRPAIWLSVSVVFLLACAAPVLLMHTGNTQMSATTYPDDEYAKQGWVLLERDFSLGKASPVQIVIDGPAASAEVKDSVAQLQTALQTDSRFGPAQVQVGTAGDLTVVTVPYSGDPAGDDAQAAIAHVRGDVVPKTVSGDGARAYVGGDTAFVVDYLDFFDTWLLRVIVLVLSLSFILLLIAFRSIVIPAKAILMNLLSVGAAYGLLVLVFQKGVGASLLGLTQVDAIEAWVPLLLFCMLFGLSMDYQVFLLSRIKERFDHTGDTREAVAYGIGRTASIITGAAAIMVCVFAGMAAGELVMFQQMGFGLAVAVLLDATVVRTIVVPAAMELLGDKNWYLPGWLEWIPNVSIEGHGYEAVPAEEAVAGESPIPE